jgi:hypothetical protein
MSRVVVSAAENSSGHLSDALAYLRAAELALDAGLYKPCASSACLSAIRSSDAVCVAELSQHSVGQGHAAAYKMLVETSLGEAGSQLLESIIQEKNDHQYTLATTSGEAAEELVSGARQMYERARAAVRRAGYPVP